MSANVLAARVDYRLIHGQVITKWIKQYDANRIIIIDDELSKDNFLSQVFKMSAPEGIQVDIVSVKNASNLWKVDKNVKGKIFLLFKNVKTVEEVVNQGLRLSELQIGGYEKKEGYKLVHVGIYMGKEDLDRLENIQKKGTKVYFQRIPEEECTSLCKVLNNY